MPRYFTAIPLPHDARDRLMAAQPPAIAGIRLIGREELHLTLHFLAEVAPNDIDKLHSALATIETIAFTVDVKGTGKFPPDGEAKILWAGVVASAELIALHRNIGKVLSAAIGFVPEERPYSPHVTLARINEPVPSGVIERYLGQNEGFVIPSVLLDRFVLFSSRFEDNVPRVSAGTRSFDEPDSLGRAGEH
jgi:2'-5' RNA ligase